MVTLEKVVYWFKLLVDVVILYSVVGRKYIVIEMCWFVLEADLCFLLRNM